MSYEGTLYRPPFEAYSFVLQAIIGGSHNLCTYCDMYHRKEFGVRDCEEFPQEHTDWSLWLASMSS